MASLSNPDYARFWQRTEWRGDCRVWRGSINSDGYGTLTVRRQSLKAHRVAYEEKNGAIPAGMVVRHRCDNPACVNPAHLEIGTDADNARDKAVRGRAATKLSVDQVRSIRRDRRTCRAVAHEYQISPAAVSLIRTGKRRIYVGA